MYETVSVSVEALLHQEPVLDTTEYERPEAEIPIYLRRAGYLALWFRRATLARIVFAGWRPVVLAHRRLPPAKKAPRAR